MWKFIYLFTSDKVPSYRGTITYTVLCKLLEIIVQIKNNYNYFLLFEKIIIIIIFFDLLISKSFTVNDFLIFKKQKQKEFQA